MTDKVPPTNWICRPTMDDFDDIDERLVRDPKRSKSRMFKFSAQSSAAVLYCLKELRPDQRMYKVVLGFAPLGSLKVLRRVASCSSSCQRQDSRYSKLTFMHWLVDFIVDSETTRCDAGEKDGLLKGSLFMETDLPPAKHTASRQFHNRSTTCSRAKRRLKQPE
ncbi:uncharacterized protein LOC144167282 [Haemaphysalis longicornis]